MLKKLALSTGNNLNQTISPFIFSVWGLATVVYGLYLLVPKTNAYTLITYSLFQDYYFNYIFCTSGVIIGLWTFLVPRLANRISKMITPLYLMSVYWFSISTFILIGNWHSNSWILTVFLALVCMIGAANYSVNRDSERYKLYFKK